MHRHKHGDKNNNPFAEEQKVKDEQNKKDAEDRVESEQPEQKVEKSSEENQKLKEDYEKLNNQYIRLAADFDNFRKRSEQERENLLKYGTEEALKKIIEVLDNFERAQKSIDSVEDCSTLKETFSILHKQTVDSLQKMGLEEIVTQGEKFDPNFHEAVMQTQTEDYPEETIIKELQKGYKFGDKVLRPALVDVAVQ